MRPPHGFLSPPETPSALRGQQSTSKARAPAVRRVPAGEKEGISLVGLRNQAEVQRSRPQLQTFPLSPRPVCRHCSRQCRFDTRFPPRHLFAHEAGSEGETTMPGAREQLPLHRGAPQSDQPAASQFSGSQKEQKAQMPPFLVFPLVVPSALASPELSPLSPTPHPNLPGGLFLFVFLNPHESPIADLNPDTK